jgi:HK97 family phage portal protein
VKIPFLSGFLAGGLGGGQRDIPASDISGLENPSVDIISAIVANVDGATSSGVSMTPLKAFRLTAVYGCVRVVTESVATLPIEISENDATGEGRVLVPDDERWDFLNEFPNPEMTGVELIGNWIAHAMLWGRGYLYIEMNKAGKILGLWPLKPDVTRPVRLPNGELAYESETDDHARIVLPAERVIPLQAVLGISPVTNSRDMLAAASAAQQYGGRFWANNARPGGIIELPEEMGDEQMDEFMKRWKAGHEGLKRSQLVGILSGGAKWQDVGISPEQAQFLETKRYATHEIARLWGVPMHRLNEPDAGQSRVSKEQESIDFLTYALRGWIVSAEQALTVKLFGSKQDRAAKRKPRFNFDALLRGDMKSMFEAFAIGIQWGFLSRADVRRRLGERTMDEEFQLEEFLVPLNMIPSSKLDQIDVNSSASKSGGGGDNNKDGGGTQPTTGSDGSTAQKNALALLSVIMRDKPELAEHIRQFALERAEQRALAAGKPVESD